MGGAWPRQYKAVCLAKKNERGMASVYHNSHFLVNLDFKPTRQGVELGCGARG